MNHTAASQSKRILLGGGCFWCLETIFQRMDGVVKVTSGYSGGETINPSYQQVCSGNTGHAEVIEVVYEPAKTNLEKILSLFFTIHDPTTLNRQGNDIGTQYRSAIYYYEDQEKSLLENLIEKHQKDFSEPIVTELAQAREFYPAEIEHHDYYNQNKNQPYCQLVIKPKIDKYLKWKE